MSSLCPYCLDRPQKSDDHVFPEFLGGTRKVRTCTKCNNTFGHGFEGPVSKDLAPVIVFLSFSGYKHKRPVVWKRAWLDETTGIEYDIDSNRQSCPSETHRLMEDGKVKNFVTSPRTARKIMASLKAKGHAKQYIKKVETKEGIRPSLKNVRINVGTEMRQLAVKMCVGVGQVVRPELVLLDDSCRRFLLDRAPGSSPVRHMYSRYSELDAQRPPLAHAVYIEGDSCSAKCFGVIQLFGGAFQFYVPLSNSYTGKDFAVMGILNVTTLREDFQQVEPLRLAEAPQFVSQDELERSLAQWELDFNAQIQAAFGKNVLVVGTSPMQSVTGLRVKVPLLWIEHGMNIKPKIEIVPDRQPEIGTTPPGDVSQWVFSPDLGETVLAVFDTFVEKWNNNELNRTLGQEHVYVPDEIVPGVRFLMGDAFWCPVKSMSISYRVHRQAWLGSVILAECSGELDQAQHVLRTAVTLGPDDIPTSRDPSWPIIEDPDSFEAAAENIIVVEKWKIDANNLKFTQLRMARVD